MIVLRKWTPVLSFLICLLCGGCEDSSAVLPLNEFHCAVELVYEDMMLTGELTRTSSMTQLVLFPSEDALTMTWDGELLTTVWAGESVATDAPPKTAVPLLVDAVWRDAVGCGDRDGVIDAQEYCLVYDPESGFPKSLQTAALSMEMRFAPV